MRTYPQDVRNQARTLRSRGMTYPEIRQSLHLDIPKGTLSYWVRNLVMPPAYQARILRLSNGNILSALASNKLKLEKRLTTLRNKNVHLISKIDLDVGKLILASLYWCEGCKYPTTRSLKFGNADPHMIDLFLTLLRNCYQLDETKFRLTIQCRADQPQSSLSQYWYNLTQIPLSQHYPPRIDKRSIGKPTQKRHYKGVCVVQYFDTNLQCELQYLGEYLGTNSALAQMKNQIR